MELYLKVRHAHFEEGLSGRQIARDFGNLNRPGFTGELLVQILSYFFSGIQGFIEVLLCFMRRDITDFAV